MKYNIRKFLPILLLSVFLCSGGLMLRQWHSEQMDRQSNEKAQELVQLPEQTPAAEQVEIPEVEIPLASEPVEEALEPEGSPLEDAALGLLELDLQSLEEVNEAVLGWITIPGTDISYPLLEVEDNNEYLRRSWDGKDSRAGCIFLECKNRNDFSDFNTIIYGHNMRNGTMFHPLRDYLEPGHLEEHPYVYIVTEQMVRRYEIFSGYEAPVVSDTYRLYFENDERKQGALDYYLESAEVAGGPVPTVEDRVLTLSTCVGDGKYENRWVVQAVLTGEFPRQVQKSA